MRADVSAIGRAATAISEASRFNNNGVPAAASTEAGNAAGAWPGSVAGKAPGVCISNTGCRLLASSEASPAPLSEKSGDVGAVGARRCGRESWRVWRVCGETEVPVELTSVAMETGKPGPPPRPPPPPPSSLLPLPLPIMAADATAAADPAPICNGESYSCCCRCVGLLTPVPVLPGVTLEGVPAPEVLTLWRAMGRRRAGDPGVGPSAVIFRSTGMADGMSPAEWDGPSSGRSPPPLRYAATGLTAALVACAAAIATTACPASPFASPFDVTIGEAPVRRAAMRSLIRESDETGELAAGAGEPAASPPICGARSILVRSGCQSVAMVMRVVWWAANNCEHRGRWSSEPLRCKQIFRILPGPGTLLGSR